ncbi:hypothetical protein N2152v2_003638 [Parachlorella kessleri]
MSLVEKWDVCGSAYDPCPLQIVTESGQPQPYNKEDAAQVAVRYPGGCSKGELTIPGKQQALDLGQWLRWRYMKEAGFLPREGLIDARTTNFARTIATLQGVLTGLYPAAQQPFRVVTTEAIDEVLYANVDACQRLKALMYTASRADKGTSSSQPGPPEVERAKAVVREVLGLGPGEKVNFPDLYDAITTAVTHHKPLPAALQDPRLQQVVEQQALRRLLSVLAPHAESGSRQEVLRLSLGRLMHFMIERMEAAAAGRPGPRLHLYSGHDSTVLPMLVALGARVDRWPPYMANIVLELWQRAGSGEHYVKVLYNRKPMRLSELCPEGEGGGASCELQHFKEHVLGPYLLSKEAHTEECTAGFHHDRPLGDPGCMEEQHISIGAALSED